MLPIVEWFVVLTCEGVCKGYLCFCVHFPMQKLMIVRVQWYVHAFSSSLLVFQDEFTIQDSMNVLQSWAPISSEH